MEVEKGAVNSVGAQGSGNWKGKEQILQNAGVQPCQCLSFFSRCRTVSEPVLFPARVCGPALELEDTNIMTLLRQVLPCHPLCSGNDRPWPAKDREKPQRESVFCLALGSSAPSQDTAPLTLHRRGVGERLVCTGVTRLWFPMT